jgi:pyroglutamyl-peptidase
MKKLLITGFEPFGGEKVNPSWLAVQRLPDIIGNFKLTKLLIPVVFGESAEIVFHKADEVAPDVILCIGQAGGRDAITPEMVGINLRYASIPDNNGNEPRDEKICDVGENAYFSTLAVRKIANEISGIKIPSKVSYSAGAYVCNDVLYSLLHKFHGTAVKAGFIHVPYIKEQEKEPSMELDDIVTALKVAIEVISDEE